MATLWCEFEQEYFERKEFKKASGFLVHLIAEEADAELVHEAIEGRLLTCKVDGTFELAEPIGMPAPTAIANPRGADVDSETTAEQK